MKLFKYTLVGLLGAAIYWGYQKYKSLKIDKIKFFIAGIGTPNIRNGMLSLPVSVGIDNQTGISINASNFSVQFYADMIAYDADGNKATLMSGKPVDTQQLILNNNAINRIDIELYTPILNLALNTISILKCKEMEIVVYPSMMGYDMDPINYKFSFGIN